MPEIKAGEWPFTFNQTLIAIGLAAGISTWIVARRPDRALAAAGIAAGVPLLCLALGMKKEEATS